MYRKDNLSKKKSCWNLIILVLCGKMLFFFSPENMIVFLRTENEK